MEALASVGEQHAAMVITYRLAHRKAAHSEANYRTIRAKVTTDIQVRDSISWTPAQGKADATDVVKNAHLQRNLDAGEVSVIREHLHELAEQRADGRTAVVEARQADDWHAGNYGRHA